MSWNVKSIANLLRKSHGSRVAMMSPKTPNSRLPRILMVSILSLLARRQGAQRVNSRSKPLMKWVPLDPSVPSKSIVSIVQFFADKPIIWYTGPSKVNIIKLRIQSFRWPKFLDIHGSMHSKETLKVIECIIETDFYWVGRKRIEASVILSFQMRLP